VSGERGISIVEVLVAVIVLSIGLLGLASTAAMTTRMIGDSRRYTEASAVATRRSEMLRSQSCATLTNGSEVKGGYSVTWKVTNPGMANPARQIDVSVTTTLGRGRTRTYAFPTTISC
jgi:type IV pilus modification protein PilV